VEVEVEGADREPPDEGRGAGADSDRAIAAGLRRAGFRLRQSGPVLGEDVAWRSLAGSGARLRGGIEVLALEHRTRGDALRALVVCDRDVEGERLAARQVLRALVSDPRTEHLDPILVTGSVFWIDDDLWPRLAPRLPGLGFVAERGHHALDVGGWPTSERVALATRLLGEGLTRCLVGTRHLLGEGWDCPAVNVVLDLSGITASVTVNQVRGRGLRPDPADASKVASLWDVVGLAPGVPDGDRMWRELGARHRHTFGVDGEGHIRAGAGRIDPVLAESFAATLADLEGMRGRMEERCAEAEAVAARWAVGRDYRDQRVWRAIGAPAALGGPRRRVAPPEAPRPAAASALDAVRRDGERGAGRFVPLLALGGGALGLLALPVVFVAGPLLGLALGAGVGWVLRRRALGRLRARLDRRGAVARALHAALAEVAPGLGPLRMDAEQVWAEGDEEASRRFAAALAELGGPVRAPRYLLIEADGSAWPVPEELGARRDLAERLAGAWTTHVGPAALLYARSPAGRAALRELWRQGAAGGVQIGVVEDWE
jgi:hypothetical protein